MHKLKKVIAATYFPIFAVFLLSLGFTLSSARGAAPDELAQNASSWYTFKNFKPPANYHDPVTDIPSVLVESINCFAFKPNVDSSCITQRSSRISESFPTCCTYSPIYYFIVGAGQHLAHYLKPGYADYGGRIASLFWNFLILIFSIRIASKNLSNSFLLLPIILTPMSLFLFGTVNPSGAEISAGILFTLCLINYFNFQNQPKIFSKPSAILGGSFLYFTLTRPIAIIWAFVIFGALLLGSKKQVKNLKSIILVFLPGLAISLIYFVFHPPQTGSPAGYTPVPNASYRFYFEGFIYSIENFPKRLHEAIGVLGWLDTPMPVSILIVYLLTFTVFLSKILTNSGISFKFISYMIGSAWILPAAIELVSWHDWPGWWQGRYSLPLYLPLLLVIFYSGKDLQKESLMKIFAITLQISGLMLVINLLRYSFGIQSFGWIPTRLSDPAMPQLILFLTGIIYIFIVFYSTTLMINFRSKK
jgi:hypothetical protein